MRQFKKVAVGGTFDKLHKGHRALLGKALEIGEKVVIGLTSDSFVAKMGKPHKTAPYDERRRELEAYLTQQGFARCTEIVPLSDTYGLTISGQGFDALVVSRDTLKIAYAINEKRQKAGLTPLEIVTVEMVPAENDCPISTTRIRSGEIDRNGHMLKQAV